MIFIEALRTCVLVFAIYSIIVFACVLSVACGVLGWGCVALSCMCAAGSLHLGSLPSERGLYIIDIYICLYLCVMYVCVYVFSTCALCVCAMYMLYV